VPRPIVVVSDVHLGHRQCDDVARDLARLVAEHPGHEIILNGDTFNLSCDRRDVDPGASAAAMIAAHPALRDALARHAAAGDRLTIVAGNHDADVTAPAVATALGAAVGGDLDVEPWFLTRQGVHIEHGQLYDADNAPVHPLARPSYRTEPLGVALSRRFLGPYDAYDLGNRYDATPQDNVRELFRRFGWRAPFVVLHYCGILATLNVETLSGRRLDRERREGDAAVATFCGSCGVDAAAVRALLAVRPAPTHTSAARTFGRFDFDGAIAALSVPGGLAAALSAPVAGGALAAAGVSYLLLSRQRRARRSANHMPEDLRAGAAIVRRLTGARLVIFGHTHREDESEGYLNLGAFGDAPRPSRTYVRIDESGRVERPVFRPAGR
jgi:UDP-2,3-diacylglucosamine pyrophosphatase LpxH